MNGRTTIPVKAWKNEAAQLTAERQSLYAEHAQIKEETRSIEAIRYCVEHVMRGEPKIRTRQEKEVEL
ncbi:MAG: hypothetical protein VB051_03555 [Candidatus Pelethousia sp.]|nr:hypothetical protein [Candidatus Pelethousia sp.]